MTDDAKKLITVFVDGVYWRDSEKETIKLTTLDRTAPFIPKNFVEDGLVFDPESCTFGFPHETRSAYILTLDDKSPLWPELKNDMKVNVPLADLRWMTATWPVPDSWRY